MATVTIKLLNLYTILVCCVEILIYNFDFKVKSQLFITFLNYYVL